MTDRPRSADLAPGTVVRWRGTSDAVLERRKDPDDRAGADWGFGLPFFPGWWLADNRGGLADFVIDDPERFGWEIVPAVPAVPAVTVNDTNTP